MTPPRPSSPARPRALAAFADGLGRVRRAPVVWLSAWLATLAIALPVALVLRGMVGDHLEASLAAESTASGSGVNYDWLQEFRSRATGVGATLDLSVLGFAAVVRHASDLLDRVRMAPVLAGVLAAWLVVWSFLSGGILDRYARDRPTWASGFFAACGTHVFRFMRLGVLAAAAYGVLFAWVHPWWMGTVARWLTRDLAVERTAFWVTLVLYVVFGLLLIVVSLVFDYARVRIVVEDRRSAIGALAAGARFVWRHRGSVAGIQAMGLLGLAAGAGAYAWLAPGSWQNGWVWPAFVVGQVWILFRVGMKLVASAAAVSLFQRELAHGAFVAPAMPEWPESPAAEALRGEPHTSAVP